MRWRIESRRFPSQLGHCSVIGVYTVEAETDIGAFDDETQQNEENCHFGLKSHRTVCVLSGFVILDGFQLSIGNLLTSRLSH